MLAFAASYASLFLLLLWTALRGQSVVALGASIAIWAAVTALGLWIGFGPRVGSKRTAAPTT